MRTILGTVLAAVLLAGCGDSPNEVASGTATPNRWGPLTVLEKEDDADFEQRAAASGVVEITADCVTLRIGEGDQVRNLAWLDDRTTWDSQQNAIVFKRPGDSGVDPTTIEDGSGVTLGGGDSDPNVDYEWLNAPADSCPTNTFIVYNVALANTTPLPADDDTS